MDTQEASKTFVRPSTELTPELETFAAQIEQFGHRLRRSKDSALIVELMDYDSKVGFSCTVCKDWWTFRPPDFKKCETPNDPKLSDRSPEARS